MSTELPTRTDLFVNALAALDSARSALSDARDWLRSNWEPVDTALPHEAARARAEMLAAIGEAKDVIDAMKRDAYQAIESLAAGHH